MTLRTSLRLLLPFHKIFQHFFAYLESNWLPNRELFADYACAGLFLMDNHTNNHLEHCHHTIKAVTRSSQILVGTLVQWLQSIIHVRSVATLHDDFKHRFKSTATNQVIRQYEAFLSWFACDRVAHEYIKSQSIIMLHVTSLLDNKFQIGIKLVSSSLYSCAIYCNFLLSCRLTMGVIVCRWLGCDSWDWRRSD